ncbi:MAG: PKD domain-containing protein [Planctomycetota bacterium]
MKTYHWFVFTSMILILGAGSAPATTFYVDPVNGSMAGDGSAANPWSTLAEVISNNKIESMKPAAYPYAYGDPLVAFNVGAPVQPGDTLELLSGDHGDVYAQGYYNPDWIIIRAATGHTPVVRRFQFRGGCKWHIDGVTVSQEPYGTPGTITAVNFENHSWHGPCYDCILENSHVYGVDDTSNFTANDWLTLTPGSGVSSGGPRNIIRYNTIRNIQLGISVGGDDSVIEHNVLSGIAHDGLRSAGDRIVWQYNHLSDFVDVDDNHDDMIQLYRGGGVAHTAVEIRANYFDGRKITGRPLTTSPQGVGCFDGPLVDVLVENNVVLTAHYHGISLYDANGCVIINNTALDPSRAYPCWITLGTKNVTGNSNCTIRNNLSYQIPSADPANNIVVDHNIVLTDTLSDSIFVDWRNGDVHLLADGPAVDQGSSELAPTVDIEGTPRPQGNGWDIGAYESAGSGNLPPVADAGTDQNVTDSDDNGSEDVTLDGSASYDTDGTIVSYVWEENAAQIATGATPVVTLNVGLHAIDLTVTDDDTATDTDSVLVDVAPAAGTYTSSTTWQTHPLGSTETGTFTVEFDARPNDTNMDGVTGICLGTATTWGDLACIVRFNTGGTIDVRNGGAYGADATVSYAAGTYYHVRMVINVPSHIYSVYVTPDGGSETTLATDYAFRTEQASVASLDSWAIQAVTGTHTVANMTVGGVQNQPPVADAGTDQNVTDSDDNGSEDVTLDGSASYDTDGTIVSYVWEENAAQIATGATPVVTLSVATHTIDLTVTDDDTATDTDSVVVTVNAYVNQAPVANAGDDQTVTDSDDNGSEDVTLDGSASYDADGTIVSYVWEENSTQIATGATPVVTLSVAVHTIDLTVTDDDTATDTDSVVVTVEAPTAGTVLFVTGVGTLDAADQVVADLLTTDGYTVTVIDDNVATAGDATGKVLVVISATVNANKVGATFRTVAVPVLTWEKDIFDDMDLATNANVERKQTQVAIVDAAHPMAAGLSGTVTVYASQEYLTWGAVTGDADVVASVAGDASKATLFGYDAADIMANGYTAPARRVGVFLDDDSAEVLTTDGTSLIDAALDWALGL